MRSASNPSGAEDGGCSSPPELSVAPTRHREEGRERARAMRLSTLSTLEPSATWRGHLLL
eukprot:5707287-Alexandrium_andersonii.AAC.1